MQSPSAVHFAPELYVANGIHDISFYERAFGARENLRFNNDDGSLHVAELAIGDAIFHLHEQMGRPDFNTPAALGGSSVCIGLFVPDVDAVIEKAAAAGATVVNPPTDYEYGYRQATIRDPFGHFWQVQKKI